MWDTVDFVVARARPKIKALLRSRAFYSVGDLITQLKTHTWDFIEYNHGCVLHASDSNLARIDRLQNSFVHELCVTEDFCVLDSQFRALGSSERHRNLGLSSQTNPWRMSPRDCASPAFRSSDHCVETSQSIRNPFRCMHHL